MFKHTEMECKETFELEIFSVLFDYVLVPAHPHLFNKGNVMVVRLNPDWIFSILLRLRLASFIKPEHGFSGKQLVLVNHLIAWFIINSN